MRDFISGWRGFIPSANARSTLRPGDVVNVIPVLEGAESELVPEYSFRVHGGRAFPGNLIWVTVVECQGTEYVGRVQENSPVVPKLVSDSLIKFGPDNVIEILTFRDRPKLEMHPAEDGDRRMVFNRQSDRVTRVTITGPKGRFGIWSGNVGADHAIGFESRPLFQIWEPVSLCGNEWAIRISVAWKDGFPISGDTIHLAPTNSGYMFEDKQLSAADEYGAFFANYPDSSQLALLRHLPPGTYFIIRTNRWRELVPKVTLGNWDTMLPLCIRGFDGYPGMAVIGSNPEQQPNLSLPLVGSVSLNTNSYGMTNILFFSFAPPMNLPVRILPSEDVLVVVPADGEFIWAPTYYSNKKKEYRPLYERWCRETLPVAVEYLAGEAISYP